MSGPVSEAVKIAAELCREFEGLRLKPYLCPAGYPTIGYGTVYKPNGVMVTLRDEPITKEIAEAWLTYELKNKYVAGVLRYSPNLVNNVEALAAMGDFAYNLGVGRYKASTLRKRIQDEDWGGAKEQLMKWVRGGGRILPGLVRRRKAECEIF